LEEKMEGGRKRKDKEGGKMPAESKAAFLPSHGRRENPEKWKNASIPYVFV
jgi:hypothetical protein